MSIYAWHIYDDTDRAIWRRSLGDGTVLEVHDYGSSAGWTHARVDEDGYYHDRDDLIAAHGGYPDAQVAMGAADEYADQLGPMIYRPTCDKSAALLGDPTAYFRICRAQRFAEVKGEPIPRDRDVLNPPPPPLAKRTLIDRLRAVVRVGTGGGETGE